MAIDEQAKKPENEGEAVAEENRGDEDGGGGEKDFEEETDAGSESDKEGADNGSDIEEENEGGDVSKEEKGEMEDQEKSAKKKRGRKGSEEEVEEDGEEGEEDKEAEPEKQDSPKTPNKRPTRERKTVERYSEPSSALRSPPTIPLTIAKGSGTRLKDIPNVAYKLSKRKPDDSLQLLHTILFGKKAKVHNLKKDIGEFSGFVWIENEEKQRGEIKEKIDKCVKEKLVDFCDILNIPACKTCSKKKDLSVKLLEFLQSPHATTHVLLDEKEQKGKRRKSKATPSTSSSSSEKSAKDSDEDSDEDYDEDSDEDSDEDFDNITPKHYAYCIFLYGYINERKLKNPVSIEHFQESRKAFDSLTTEQQDVYVQKYKELEEKNFKMVKKQVKATYGPNYPKIRQPTLNSHSIYDAIEREEDTLGMERGGYCFGLV